MKKHLQAIALSLSLLLVGCSNRANTNVISISILNSKPEIQNKLEGAAKDFSSVHPDINVKIVQYSPLQDVSEKMSSLINQETTSTLMIIDPLYAQNIKDDLVALDQESWVKDMQVNKSSTSLNSQGELIAFPFAVEGMGYIYNSQVMKAAGIDVTKIATRDDLAAAFAKVEAIGKKAIVISNEDWSLANHFLTTGLTLHSENDDETLKYVQDLKAGKVDLHTDSKINGLLDTFDLMKAHNYYKENPFTPTAEKCAELLATGEVGFWYMGNWASENLNKYADSNAEFGFIPVPISNVVSDYGHDSILSVIKYAVIDKKHNSVGQQEAAKEFLNWLAYNQTATDFIINEAGLIPGVLATDVQFTNSLSQSIQSYLNEGKTIEQIMAYLPDNNIATVGPLMRQYLDNSIDRKTLLDGIANAWKEY